MQPAFVVRVRAYRRQLAASAVYVFTGGGRPPHPRARRTLNLHFDRPSCVLALRYKSIGAGDDPEFKTL